MIRGGYRYALTTHDSYSYNNRTVILLYELTKLSCQVKKQPATHQTQGTPTIYMYGRKMLPGSKQQQ